MTVDFKEQLAQWAAESSKNREDGENGESGVVVCVDELDRCRPDYALSLLEVTRHLFDVPGVVVLLVINRSELAHSVKSISEGTSTQTATCAASSIGPSGCHRRDTQTSARFSTKC